MPQQLMSVELDEVSLVDVPANQLAKVTLTKRVDPELNGVRLVLGFHEGGAAVSGVLFSKGWTQEMVGPWLAAHHFTVGKLHTLPEGELRADLMPGANFQKFRTITPGGELSKALQHKVSYTDMQGIITQALETQVHELFGKDYYPYLRDLHGDHVVYDDRNSQLWQVPYEVTMKAVGEPVVTFGERVPVEVVYKAKTADEPKPGETEPKPGETEPEAPGTKPKKPYDAEEEDMYKRLNTRLDQSAHLSDKLFQLFTHLSAQAK